MCLKHVGKKKLLGRYNKIAKWLNYFQKIHNQTPEVFCTKAVLLKSSQYSQGKQENTCVGVSFHKEFNFTYKNRFFQYQYQK